MAKNVFIFLTIFVLLVLGGCAEAPGASAGKIIPPSNQTSPLGGKWMVLQELDVNSNEEETWEGSSVRFAADAVAFGGHVWESPSYKIKRVKAADYLMTKYITSSGIFVPGSREVDVITIYTASNFLGEVMRLDDARMIFSVQNKDLLLKKVSDQTDVTLDTADKNTFDLSRGSNKGASGVLLGLRAPSGGDYTYRTLWIAADQHQLHPILSAEQLFFPRISGFWELSVQSSDGVAGNMLAAQNVAAKPLETKQEGDRSGVRNVMKTGMQDSMDVGIQNRMEEIAGTGASDVIDQATRVINYVGNDYVSIEKITNGINRLQVLPVDNLSSPTVIKIHDLLGYEGLTAYLNAREHAIASVSGKETTLIESGESGENFGLVRKNGHWFFVGRINYQRGGKYEQTDFDLKIIPPANLIFYDTLVLNWLNIKDRVPDASDAFTSPNKDIALVKTKNKLKVYTIGTEKLAENPLAEIDLQEGEAMIMAEWATGLYVDNWERSFLSYGAQALTDSPVQR
ncbi:MAG: hypothetical protein PHE79_06090 [Eubacteriales bacterium]|nr:hypothetical protein [Eubacteriales bacterium]